MIYKCIFQWTIKLCSCFGHCRRRFFSPEKGSPNVFGHVQIEKSVFLLVLYVFCVLFYELSSFVPTLDIAAGFGDMSKLRNLCFYAFLMHPMCFSMNYQALFLLWTLPQAPFFPSKRRSQIFWTCPNWEISVFISFWCTLCAFNELSSFVNQGASNLSHLGRVTWPRGRVT